MELLEQYNITDIIEVVILLGLAIKGVISFFEWLFPRIEKLIKKVDQPEKLKYDLKKQYKEIDDMKNCIKQIIGKIDILIESDKDDIKAFITRQHHYFVYQKGWIDDYSLDCIERRYDHYVHEKGNSFIGGLMEEIRALPKQEQEKQQDKEIQE